MSGALKPNDITDLGIPRAAMQIDENFNRLTAAVRRLQRGGSSSSASGISLTFPTTVSLGDLLVGAAGSSLVALADVAVGSYLRSGGAGASPLWSTLTLPNAATAGDLLYASATDTISGLADVAAGSFLRSGGVGVAPTWSTLVLPNAATAGDLLYASAANTISALADVAAGSFLRSGGVGVAPTWSTLVLPNAATTGDLLYASASNTIAALADVAAGSFLRSGGTSTAPAWSTNTIPNTATLGDIWYASATNVISALAKSTTATRYLANTGTSNVPAWDQVNVANGVTGLLGATNGGTGLDTSAVADGQLLIGQSSGHTWGLAQLTAGTGISITNAGHQITVAVSGVGQQGKAIPWGSIRKFGLASMQNVTNTVSNTGAFNSNASTLFGTQTTVNDAKGFWLRCTGNTASGNQRQVSVFGSNFTWLDRTPVASFRIRINPAGGSITNFRAWFFLSQNGSSTSFADDLHTQKYIGARYSTSAGDAGLVCAAADGASQTIGGGTIVVLASNTVYRVDITVTSTTTFKVEVFDETGVLLGSQTASVPSGTLGGNVAPGVFFQNTDNATVHVLDWSATYTESF